jgi:X-Pro dipeptidyl-peptidase
VCLAAANEANGIGQLGAAGFRARAAETIVDDASIDATELVAAAQSPHRLIYQSPPLTARLYVSGTASVRMRVAIDRPAAIVSAMLVEYPAAGAR